MANVSVQGAEACLLCWNTLTESATTTVIVLEAVTAVGRNMCEQLGRLCMGRCGEQSVNAKWQDNMLLGTCLCA